VVDDGSRILAGRYEVGELIGRGGMAEVHIGHDTRLGRTVAIKILRATPPSRRGSAARRRPPPR
jgi:serine/threonine-protein kinase